MSKNTFTFYNYGLKYNFIQKHNKRFYICLNAKNKKIMRMPLF